METCIYGLGSASSQWLATTPGGSRGRLGEAAEKVALAAVASSGGGDVVTWICVSLTGKTRLVFDGRLEVETYQDDPATSGAPTCTHRPVSLETTNVKVEIM